MSDTYYIEFSEDLSKDGEVYKRYSSKNQPFKSIFIDVEVTELILKSDHDQIVKGLEAEIAELKRVIQFDQEYSQHGEDELNKITSAARQSWIKATSCARGQTITASDSFESHLIWAAQAFERTALQSENKALRRSIEESVQILVLHHKEINLECPSAFKKLNDIFCLVLDQWKGKVT